MAGIFGLSGSGFSTGVTSVSTPFQSLLSDGPKARSTTFAVASALTLVAVTSGCGSTPQQVAVDRNDEGCARALVESEHRAHKTEAIGSTLFGLLGLGIGFVLGRRSKR